MTVKKTLQKGEGKEILIWTDDVDEVSTTQLINVAKLPFIYRHVSAMPDVHAGMGATIGSVIATEGAVIPAAVGVDIGCGMLSVKTSLRLSDSSPQALCQLMEEILKRVPVGLSGHYPGSEKLDACVPFADRLAAIKEKYPHILSRMTKLTWQNEMGTLGSGNHFIELSKDEEDNLWVMLHSGSRGPGNLMAEHFIRMAKKNAAEKGIELPDDNLAYFEEGTSEFDDYMEAVHWAQDYALANRSEMLKSIMCALQVIWPSAQMTSDVINCHHNYVRKENHFGQDVWVTRKGATSAFKGELGIIPGSMGANSYIVRGLGEPSSFCSSSHGAGRRLSRTAAKKEFTVEDLCRQTEGVVCRKDKKVLDEIPRAYKDIDTVMANQTDLVEPVVKLKQILCVKG